MLTRRKQKGFLTSYGNGSLGSDFLEVGLPGSEGRIDQYSRRRYGIYFRIGEALFQKLSNCKAYSGSVEKGFNKGRRNVSLFLNNVYKEFVRTLKKCMCCII